MNNTTRNVQRTLLAAALALPLAAWAGPADGAGEPDAPEHGQRADGRRGPPPPEGLREGEDFDGPGGPGGPRGPGHHPGRGVGPAPLWGDGFEGGFAPLPPYLRGVELTEAQQDKIFALVHGQVPYLREQMKARVKAERGLAELHGAPRFDDAQAVKLAQAAAQAEANVTLAQLRTEQKVLAVLTAEQRNALAERRDGRRGPPPGAARPDTNHR